VRSINAHKQDKDHDVPMPAILKLKAESRMSGLLVSREKVTRGDAIACYPPSRQGSRRGF